MDDLVKRLRGPAKIDDRFSAFYIFARDARAGADRIEALEAELTTARALIAELEGEQARADGMTEKLEAVRSIFQIIAQGPIKGELLEGWIKTQIERANKTVAALEDKP